jgi:hypothetical protein
MAIHKSASWLCFLAECALATAATHATAGTESNVKEGFECETHRVITYRVHQGWGYSGDIIIGREAELEAGCIRMPQGLSDSMAKENMSTSSLWPGGVVPYFINPQITAATRSLIADAVQHFADYTPVRFVPYTGQPDFVGFEDIQHAITPPDEVICGGVSVVGRKGGGQPIWLNQDPGCVDKGTVIHEMMHALGFQHEQQRPDRDGYVNVSSASNCRAADYMQLSQVPFGPYDYSSIMHYAANACLSQRQAFAIPLTLCRGTLITSIGQHCSLSDGDFFALWHFYAPASTPRPALTTVQRNAALEIVLRKAKASTGTPTPSPIASPPGALSGLWWGGPPENGWGIVFTQRGGSIFAAWFTYDQFGSPIWYVASNCAGVSTNASSGTCSGTLYRVNGHAFFGVAFVPVNSSDIIPVGNLQVTFTSSNTAVMSYSLAGQSRSVSIVRQPLASGTTPPAINYTDLWWAGPQESGWGITITQQYSTIFIAWFVYDAAGQPIWYVASNCPVIGSGCSATLYRTVGPPGQNFNAAGNQIFPVGSINVNFSDSNNGTISYTVNGISGSKAIIRQLF